MLLVVSAVEKEFTTRSQVGKLLKRGQKRVQRDEGSADELSERETLRKRF